MLKKWRVFQVVLQYERAVQSSIMEALLSEYCFGGNVKIKCNSDLNEPHLHSPKPTTYVPKPK